MGQNKWFLQRLHLRGYTLQLFLFTLLPLTILVLIVAIGSQTLHHEAMNSLVGDRNLRAVQSAIDNLELEITGRATMLRMLAKELKNEGDLNNLSLNSEEISGLFDGGLFLLDPNRTLLASIYSSSELPPDLQNLPPVMARDSNPIIFSGATGSSSQATILIAVPAGENNILVGRLKAEARIRASMGTLLTGSQSAILVVGQGKETGSYSILFERGQPAGVNAHLQHHPGVPEVMSGKSGILYEHAAEDEAHPGESVLVYSPISLLGWGVVVEEPWEGIASPLLRNTQSAPLVMIPVLLLSVIALWYGAQSIVQPLNRLENQAAQLARGDFDAVRAPVGGIPEIQHLQAALIDMADKLYDARQSLHSYIGVMTAGIENERRSLARELHDDTIQSLIALNQRIQLAGMRAPESSKAAFAELQDMVQQTMINLRRLIRGLRPIYLEDLGLVTALQMLVQETQETAGLPIQFQVTGTQRRLQPDQEMSLYRITQESLANVVRHAATSTAQVSLIFTKESLSLTIRDNGVGFQVPDSPSEFSHSGHFGLLGIQERAELIGASLSIHSAPNQGTRVEIQLPSPGTNGTGFDEAFLEEGETQP